MSNPETDEVTISLKQTEFYSATFTLQEAAEALECEPTEEAIGEAIEKGDVFGTRIAEDVLNGWDMADNSEWSLM